MASVLVIESDSLGLDLLTFLLKQDGHRVFAARDTQAAFVILSTQAIDLVTIETGCQGPDGVQSCQRIRQLNPWLPLIIVSERGDEDQVVHGLGVAADDYIRKPFSPHELLARVRALLRRANLNQASYPLEDSIMIGEVTLDQLHMCAIVNGARVSLTPRELSLLRVFMRNPDRVLSRDRLIELAWGDDFVATRKAVDVYVLRLRKKIRPYLTDDFYVRSLRGFGYLFAGPMPQVATATAEGGLPFRAPARGRKRASSHMPSRAGSTALRRRRDAMARGHAASATVLSRLQVCHLDGPPPLIGL